MRLLMYNIHGITETYRHIVCGYIFGQDTAARSHTRKTRNIHISKQEEHDHFV